MSMRPSDSPSHLMSGQEGDASVFNDDASGDSFSVIDRFSTFDGTFHSSRDLRIEGEAKGTIECQGTLMVAQGATVTAKIEAEHVSVAGDLNGDIHCRGRLQIMPSGKVRGKVTTQSLVINEGAFYEGQLEMAAMQSLSTATTKSPRPIAPISSAGSAERTAVRPTVEAPVAGASNTFIRRFGGPETPWVEDEDGDGDEAT